jgi:hypothetical protein
MPRCGSGARPGCGKEIRWGRTADGKNIPLDPAAPVYKLGPFDAESGLYAVEKVDGFKVSHFATCAQANNFSKGTKPQKSSEGQT